MDVTVGSCTWSGGCEVAEKGNPSVIEFGFLHMWNGNDSGIVLYLSKARRRRDLLEALWRGRFPLQPLFLQMCEEGIVPVLQMRKETQHIVTRGHKIEASAWYWRFSQILWLPFLLNFALLETSELVKMFKSKVVFSMLSDINSFLEKNGVSTTLWGCCGTPHRRKLFVNCAPLYKRVRLFMYLNGAVG